MKEMQELLKQIPKGKVTTYKILSRKLKIHPRVVGMLLSMNPEPVKYPCFKVINSNGNLGGYSGGGLKKKIALLKKDGIQIQKNKIDLKIYGFNF